MAYTGRSMIGKSEVLSSAGEVVHEQWQDYGSGARLVHQLHESNTILALGRFANPEDLENPFEFGFAEESNFEGALAERKADSIIRSNDAECLHARICRPDQQRNTSALRQKPAGFRSRTAPIRLRDDGAVGGVNNQDRKM